MPENGTYEFLEPDSDFERPRKEAIAALPVAWNFPDGDKFKQIMSNLQKLDLGYDTNLADEYSDERMYVVIEIFDRVSERIN